MIDERPGERPIGPNHALLIGQLVGLVTSRPGVGEPRVLDDAGGHHTDEFLIVKRSGVWRVSVKPERVDEP